MEPIQTNNFNSTETLRSNNFTYVSIVTLQRRSPSHRKVSIGIATDHAELFESAPSF